MQKLQPGDRARVTADWIKAEDKQRRVCVAGFQKNGAITFIKVRWVGQDSQRLSEDYGNLFEECELKRIG
jgi:hypothetical protein